MLHLRNGQHRGVAGSRQLRPTHLHRIRRSYCGSSLPAMTGLIISRDCSDHMLEGCLTGLTHQPFTQIVVLCSHQQQRRAKDCKPEQPETSKKHNKELLSQVSVLLTLLIFEAAASALLNISFLC